MQANPILESHWARANARWSTRNDRTAAHTAALHVALDMDARRRARCLPAAVAYQPINAMVGPRDDIMRLMLAHAGRVQAAESRRLERLTATDRADRVARHYVKFLRG